MVKSLWIPVEKRSSLISYSFKCKMDPGWPSNPPLQVIFTSAQKQFVIESTRIFNPKICRARYFHEVCLTRWFAPCAGQPNPCRTGPMPCCSTSPPSTLSATTSNSSSPSPCSNPSMLEGNPPQTPSSLLEQDHPQWQSTILPLHRPPAPGLQHPT